MGHEVIVLIGDFTARIGDPGGKMTTRQQLSRDEVLANMKNWLQQIKPIINFDDKVNPPRILYNHDWLAKLTMEDIINLASNVTVQQMLERDMFARRLQSGKPIYLHEFMYPLMQGYDSVAMEVDVELCGTDQIFNALVGRTLLKKFKNKDKFVVAANLMANPATGELMSKSLGTGIFLDLVPEDMYGAIMSQADEMIRVFLISNTRVPLSEIEKILKAPNPRDAKMKTAYLITEIFHGTKQAQSAQDLFIKKIQNKEVPAELAEVKIGVAQAELLEIVKKCCPDKSKSELRRLLEQGAVKITDKVYRDGEEKIEIPPVGLNLKLGKRNWFKIVK
ncbi:MAG: tyrosine--tRNA ligase, partial [Candidatus Falkowbacteria bacterium]|nr:tyrosine--tRNA ligase [Candidatus Falkowbacteria bacterium]